MSATPGAISRAKSPGSGAEYEALRAQAVGLVQVMSGDVWTDYNYSDPGVTIIEQLSYALTELPYRANFPVQDLLSPPGVERLPLRRHGLFPAWSILPCSPVTVNDLRRLVIDRVADVGNIWFTPKRETVKSGLSGLYDVAILPRGDLVDEGWRHARLVRRVLRCYSAHRALCEDVAEVRVLTRLDTHVYALVDLEDRADPSDTLAEILFALSSYLEPEPKRISLDDEIAAGMRADEIFSGPLMLRGFIADDQLTALESKIPVDQLLQVLARTTGVLAVDSISIEVSGQAERFKRGDTITVPENSVLHVRTASQEGHPTIQMYRNQVRCEPDEARTHRTLSELWKRQRRTYPLRAQYADRYAPPAPKYWNLSSYVSVQNQFPGVYGIGSGGLPPIPTAPRRAAAKQLKGYLMPFDQLLADYFSQLASVRELFSIQAAGDSTYAWQSLRPIVPGADPLLKPGYETGMVSLCAETDAAGARRNEILDVLLSFYALRISAPSQAQTGSMDKTALSAALIRAKQGLLRRAATATRDRGKGINYLRPRSERGAAGVERMSRIQLGLLDKAGDEAAPSKSDGAAHRDLPTTVEDPLEATFGRLLPPESWPTIQQTFQRIDEGWDEPVEGSWQSRSPLAGHRIAASLLPSLHDRSRYRIRAQEGGGSFHIVCVDTNRGWWMVGEYQSAGEATHAMRALIRAAGAHWRHTHQREVYIVEWLLLRHSHDPAAGDGSRYNFRISAVLSESAGEGDAANWRSQSQAILRANTPAHIALECLFLPPRQIMHFQRLYDAWVGALSNGPSRRRAKSSRRLESFLVRHGPPKQPDGTTDPKPASPDPSGTMGGAGEPLPPQTGPAAEPDAGHVTPAPSIGEAPPAVSESIAAGTNTTPLMPAGEATARPTLPAPPATAATAPAHDATGEAAPKSIWQRVLGWFRGGAKGSSRVPPEILAAPRLFWTLESELGIDRASPHPLGATPPISAPAVTSAASTPPVKPAQTPLQPATEPPARQPELGGVLKSFEQLFGGDAKPATSTAPSGEPSANASSSPQPVAEPPAQQPELGGVLKSFEQLFGGDAEPTTSTAPSGEPSANASSSPPPPPPATPLSGNVSGGQAAPPGASGFDTDTALTAETAASFVAADFSFVIRYLSQGTPEAAGDLSATELETIIGAGLAVMAVQHAAPSGWVPSQSLGEQTGTAAASNAKAVGLPQGICIWLDLEGVAAGTATDTVTQYCNAWFSAVSDAGYLPGLYVGASNGLNSQQPASGLTCKYFWRSGSNVPNIQTPGYCMTQTISSAFTINGVSYDNDIIEADSDGKTPIWFSSQTTSSG